MRSEEKQWDRLRAGYLRQVEDALSSVRHPRAKEVLDDVRSHLDRRVDELPPEQRTTDNLRAIITDMGPASDYAELLEPNGSASAHGVPKKSIAWVAVVAVIAVAIVALIVSTFSGPAEHSPEVPVDGLDALPELIAALSDPQAPRFVALNKIIEIGPPAVPALIEEMQSSFNWQIPKALGAIGDWRAVEPLIEKLHRSDFSPMRDVVAEALGRITGAEFGVSAEKWRAWWEGGPGALPELIAALSDPQAPRFVALNKIIKIGPSAVPVLIEEMQSSYNWQIPKALGAIGDWRAVEPLIGKLEESDFSPMRDVVAEALGRITGAECGVSAEKWRAWWEETGQNMIPDVSSGVDIDRARESPAVYIVTFRPVGPFTPQTARELLDAFNENHPPNVRTHHYRTRVEDGALVGCICVDTQAGKDAIVSMFENSRKLEPVEIKPATDRQLRELYAMHQVSLTSDEPIDVYIVTFRPVGAFRPQTPRELLEAFNENHPRSVRTHHYRTQATDDALIGSICVDGEAGKDAVVAMLIASEKLEAVQAKRATRDELEKRYGTSQRTSSRSPRSSRRVREPTSRNRTVARSGTWPPGDCFIFGHVSRRARLSRVDHAKARLSSDEFGTWVVEVDDHGGVDFTCLPAGTYRLCTTDTFGYRDAYYNPLGQSNERPTFELKAGDRIQPGIEIEPVRPYRKVTGRVLDSNGTALADCNGLTVSAWVQRPQGSWKGHYRALSRSAVQADGSYVLDELDGRPVYVQVRDYRPPVQESPYPPRFFPGTFSREEATLVSFGEDAVAEQIDITMQRTGGAVLEGLVTAEQDGQPVPQALVTVFHHDMFFDLFYAYTDEQGRYRLEGLGQGEFIVHVDAAHQGLVKTRKIVKVEADSDRTPLDFTLRRGANISGTLVDEKGQPYPVGRGSGNASRQQGGFSARASNFPYGNQYAPEYIRRGSTVFYEEGQGDALGTIMIFPTETSFLLPAVAPGEIVIRFRPRGPGERVTKILHQGRDILKTGLTVEPGRDVSDVTIVVKRPRNS